jgi:hypothetical protein
MNLIEKYIQKLKPYRLNDIEFRYIIVVRNRDTVMDGKGHWEVIMRVPDKNIIRFKNGSRIYNLNTKTVTYSILTKLAIADTVHRLAENIRFYSYGDDGFYEPILFHDEQDANNLKEAIKEALYIKEYGGNQWYGEAKSSLDE